MAGADRRLPWIAGVGFGIALGLAAAGCASRSARQSPLPPIPTPAPTSSAVAAATPAPTPPARTPPPETRGDAVVVVEPGGRDADEGRVDLVAAARAERERRRAATTPSIVITNANLAEFAKGQKLTIAAQGDSPAEPGKGVAEPVGKGAGVEASEQLWRERGLALRKQWRNQADELTALRAKAAELRQRFYSIDDPYQRDGEVKPAWDRTLDRISRLEDEVLASGAAVEGFLDEGRRAGVPASWLNEGLDLEPTPEAPKSAPAEPGEPVEVQERPPQ